MATVHWSDEDRIDPYPAVLETLRKVFEFANDDAQHEGVLGDGEAAIIGQMWAGCEAVVLRQDAASISLLRGPQPVEGGPTP